MTNALLIFLGAGLGGVFRYWVSNVMYFLLGREFPYGTLVVNVSGCFLVGFLFALLLDRFENLPLRSLLLIGFLGGYTTFSTFAIETLMMFKNEAWWRAFLNIFSSVTFSLVAAWIGIIGGRNV